VLHDVVFTTLRHKLAIPGAYNETVLRSLRQCARFGLWFVAPLAPRCLRPRSAASPCCPHRHRLSIAAADMAGGTAVAAGGTAVVAAGTAAVVAGTAAVVAGAGMAAFGDAAGTAASISGCRNITFTTVLRSPARVLSASLLRATLRVRLLKRPCAARRRRASAAAVTGPSAARRHLSD